MSKRNFRPTREGRPDDYDETIEDFGYDIKNIRRTTKRKVAKFKDYREPQGDS